MIAERLGRLQVRLRHRADLPVVALRVLVRGGARTERVPGESLLVGRLLSEGSGARDHRRVAREAEALGMSIGGYATHESIGVAIEALADDVDRAVAWLAEMLLEPTFSKGRVAWGKRQAVAELRAMADQPDVVAGRAFLEQIYGSHPYARPLQGGVGEIAELDSAACRSAHESALRAGAVLVVSGRVDLEALRERVVGAFGGAFAAPAVPLDAVPLPEEGEAFRRLEVPDPGQAHLYVGHRTIPRHHPDWWPLTVAGVVLGAGPGLVGRVPDRVREREGLAYHVGVVTAAGAGTDPGRFAVYVGTSPETVEQAEASVRDELETAVDGGFTDEEVEEARSWLLGRRAFRRETVRADLDAAVQAAVFGLPGDPDEGPAGADREDPASDRVATDRVASDRVDDEIQADLEACDRVRVEAALRRWLRPGELRVTVGLPRGGSQG